MSIKIFRHKSYSTEALASVTVLYVSNFKIELNNLSLMTKLKKNMIRTQITME